MTRRTFNLKAKSLAEDFISGMGKPVVLESRIARPSKYRNTPTVLEGIRFASKGEAQRWAFLNVLQKAGEINGLTRQVVYELSVTAAGTTTKHIRLGVYIADFEYWANAARRTVTEDYKGVETDLFKWKRKHFEAQYGVKLYVVKSPTADIPNA